MNISQTSVIAAALVIAWAIFVISRGELPIYLGILGIGSNPCSSSGTLNTTASAAAGALTAITPIAGILTGGF